MRVPKRGFHNFARVEYAVVNVDALERRFPAGSEVTPELLRELRVVKGRLSRLKILGRGELSKPLTVRAHRFTVEAKEKIERAGGKAEVVS
jgi:large subunit ribosomal protein L15